MIRETATSLDPGWGELVDIDVLESGEWAGLFRMDQRLCIRTPHHCVDVPHAIDFPLIRWLDPRRVALLGTRAQLGRNNAWVLSFIGGTWTSFFAGDGIQDVLAANDVIIATYFDEGVFRGIPPGEEGIAVFSASGELRSGYQSALGREAVDIADCYAACWETDSRIAFLPYTGFPLVFWELASARQTVHTTPSRVHGSSAITIVAGGEVLFFGPYHEKQALIAWAPGRSPAIVGHHPGRLRGLRGGRFLAHGTAGFTIIESDG